MSALSELRALMEDASETKPNFANDPDYAIPDESDLNDYTNDQVKKAKEAKAEKKPLNGCAK